MGACRTLNCTAGAADSLQISVSHEALLRNPGFDSTYVICGAPAIPSDTPPPLQVVFASIGQLTSADYIAASRIRARMASHMRAVFSTVDFVVTPTAPDVAPPFADDPLTLDLRLLSSTMKYMQLGNILGLAAVTVPCGVDAAGLPIGCVPRRRRRFCSQCLEARSRAALRASACMHTRRAGECHACTHARSHPRGCALGRRKAQCCSRALRVRLRGTPLHNRGGRRGARVPHCLLLNRSREAAQETRIPSGG